MWNGHGMSVLTHGSRLTPARTEGCLPSLGVFFTSRKVTTNRTEMSVAHSPYPGRTLISLSPPGSAPCTAVTSVLIRAHVLVPKYSILIMFPGCASPQLTCPHSFIQQTLPFTQGLPRGETPRLPSVKGLNNPAPLRRGSRLWGLPHCTSGLNGGRSPPRRSLFSGVTGHLGLRCLRRTAASL